MTQFMSPKYLLFHLSSGKLLALRAPLVADDPVIINLQI